MQKIIVDGKSYELADTMRVLYELRDITKAKNIREAMASLTSLDVDGQIKLLYIAYKIKAKDAAMSEEDFTNMLLDNCGVFAIVDAASNLIEALMYSGMSPEEVESKKMQVVEAQKVGTTSSATDIE